jgi:hypothetical protein
LISFREENVVKLLAMILGALFGSYTFAVAQGTGQGSVKGDPAASSQNANPDRSGMSPTKSGSGTSTSGGKDDNGDQGRDKMPENFSDQT